MSQYIRVRQKVRCCCKKCCYKNPDGCMVDTRTKRQHEEEETHFQNEFAKRRKTNSYQTIYAKSSVQSKEDEISLNEVKLAIKSITPKQTVNQIRTSSLISTKKRKRKGQFWSQESQSNTKNLNHNEYIDRFEDNDEFLDNDRFEDNDEDNDEFLDNNRFEDNDELLDNSDNMIENNDNDNNYSEDATDDPEFYEEIEDLESISINLFQAPKVDFDKPAHIPEPNININDILWILIWVFKFQERFQLSNVVTNTLISFLCLLLRSIDKSRFDKFPSNIDRARDILNFDRQNKTFTVCPKCNKLYNTTEIIPDNQDSVGFKCIHKEFPNHPRPSRRKPCGEELLKKIFTVDGHVWRPRMQYLLPSIKSQLFLMYQQDGFNMLLQKWANRSVDTNIISDIYDGEIWKTFPSQ
ncbi:19847_t:CDS:1, partial [Dentiscutata erythropus]